MAERRTDRVIVRSTAGLILLLWLLFPTGIVAAVVAGDWRWIICGFVALLTGFGLGWIMTEGLKR